MRRRSKFHIYFVIFFAIFIVVYFIYNNTSAGSKGIQNYSVALEQYKAGNYDLAFSEFGKVPYNSTLKQAALFRQARCATNIDKKDLAIKKYKKIISSKSKTAILPISVYNLAVLLYENNDNRASKKYFKKIIKEYPSSEYAIASNYYIGMIICSNLPVGKPKKLEKSKQTAFQYFKNYIEKAPDGRFSVNAINKIKELDIKLTNYDNLLIAKSYYSNGEYENAKEYLNKTTIAESWSDFAKNEYKLGNKEKANEYAQKGLKEYASSVDSKDVYEVIDSYIKAFPTRKEGIQSLVSLGLKATGADYVDYLNCNEVVENTNKEACYTNLYEKYPSGQFSADTLYNLFMIKYLQKKYFDAQRLGYLHLKKFTNVKSSPAITYYMGKTSNKLKHYESANNYYKQVISKYPDSYYAFRASYNLDKDAGFLPFLELSEKPVVFPYKKSLDNNLVVHLALLKDYDLVEELCKKDKFIQSWIAHEKGNYTVSSVLARNAMDDLDEKPSYDDLRWRLVYPLHYYDVVNNVKGPNNPIILESILKEESHFNPKARSFVGASGLMQLMPATYNEVASRHNITGDITSVVSNISAGSYYYAGLKKTLLNRDLYAITAYNGGVGSVTAWFSKLIYNDTDEFIEQIPYPETKNYVKKVLRTYWMYGNVYKYN